MDPGETGPGVIWTQETLVLEWYGSRRDSRSAGPDLRTVWLYDPLQSAIVLLAEAVNQTRMDEQRVDSAMAPSESHHHSLRAGSNFFSSPQGRTSSAILRLAVRAASCLSGSQ
ncbi:hypothetical protein NHX12_024314 [Muraenolepis orangiensis]|uniref:Uncharacterized protein n=1 Tax=Muraenolepis orangiensis TaxID=630683 RepID=A0A9Q0ISY0_9TELE|nr:hypothetical protein NHX12_024314 [Muraenolepis orangiensis]